jgi:hypothetical protein
MQDDNITNYKKYAVDSTIQICMFVVQKWSNHCKQDIADANDDLGVIQVYRLIFNNLCMERLPPLLTRDMRKKLISFLTLNTTYKLFFVEVRIQAELPNFKLQVVRCIFATEQKRKKDKVNEIQEIKRYLHQDCLNKHGIYPCLQVYRAVVG